MAEGAFRERFPDPLLESSCLLPPRNRQRPGEFGRDLPGRGAERREEGRAQAPDLGLPQLRATAHAERFVGQRHASLRLACDCVALEQQAGGDAGHAGRGCPAARYLVAHLPYPGEPG